MKLSATVTNAIGAMARQASPRRARKMPTPAPTSHATGLRSQRAGPVPRQRHGDGAESDGEKRGGCEQPESA